jgi:hypothetical protein
MCTKSGSGFWMNNPDNIFESLKHFLGFKILKFFDVDPGSGMEKIRTGMNILDPQHCLLKENISLLVSILYNN